MDGTETVYIKRTTSWSDMAVESLMLLLLILLWEVGVSCVLSMQKTDCPEKIPKSLLEPKGTLEAPSKINLYQPCSFKPTGINDLCCTETSLSSCRDRSDNVYVLKNGKEKFEQNTTVDCVKRLLKDCDASGEHRNPKDKEKYVFSCHDDDIACCTRTSNSDSNEEDNEGWGKETFILLAVVLIIAVLAVVFVIVRKRIKRGRKRHDDSRLRAKRTFTDVGDENIRGSFRYTSDLEWASGAYSLASGGNEGSRNYRPLKRPVRNTNPIPSSRHFDLRLSVHRAFENDDDDEIYTKINDDEIDCHAADREKQDDVISCHDGTELPYFELECGGQGDDTTNCNRLSCHGDKDEATQSESVSERKDGGLRCHTGLAEISVCDEYELSKPMTEADFSSGKDEEKSFHDVTASDGQYEKEAGPNTRHLPNQNCSTVAAADVDGLIRESEEHSVHSEINVSACLPQRVSGTGDATTSSSYDCIKGDNCQPASDSEQHDLMTELGSKTNAEERETPRSQGDKVAPSPSPVGKPSHNLYD